MAKAMLARSSIPPNSRPTEFAWRLHQVLTDISWGNASPRVKEFFTAAYVKGAQTCGSARNAELEGSTSVFAKRR